jgi:acyl-CoA synthetase (AMP-forming)/AMP-acid ligase II
LIELIRRAARDDPDRPAVVVDEYTCTYGELAARAERVAAGLIARGITRFAVADHDAATVAALFAGASLAGAEACQYPPLGQVPPSEDDARAVAELAARFDHGVLISPVGLPLPGLDVLPPAALTDPRAPGPAAEPPARRPHLVLTTGTTTGTPRGVRHEWNRIMRAARRVTPGTGQRWLLAYGLHQFAGLQLLVHVFGAGATLVAPAPRTPRAGLAAMRAHGVTHASATPTYWRFLLAELRADGRRAPELTQITLGGEAVPAAVLEELAGVFPQANISQVYAASEFGSSGSVRDGRNGLSLDVLDRPDDADIAMKIVDGELWVRSRVGMLGYYGEEPADPDGWRPTGDLVEIVGDRIQFRGRSRSLITVAGVKVHPLPIEERIAAVAGVDVARVYSRPNALTGAIVAVEIVAAPGADTEAVGAAVRAACSDLPAAARPRSIKFVEAVTTAGNKLSRKAFP